MIKIFVHLLFLGLSVQLFSQDLDLKYQILDQFDIGYKMSHINEENKLFQKEDGGYIAIAYNYPSTTVGSPYISVRTFSKQGNLVNDHKFSMSSAPFDQQVYLETILVEGEIVVVTRTITQQKEEISKWFFWKLEANQFVKLKEMDNSYFQKNVLTTIIQSANFEYTLFIFHDGEEYMLLNHNLEIEGTYDFLDDDINKEKNYVKLDNVFLDDNGNIALSFLFVGKVKQNILGTRPDKASWALAVINNKTKTVNGFEASTHMYHTTYSGAGSKFLDLNEHEFLFLNRGIDIFRFSKSDGEMLNYSRIDMYKNCSLSEDKDENKTGLNVIQIERINESSFVFVLHTKGIHSFQMFICDLKGNIINSFHLTVPEKWTISEVYNYVENEPFLLVRNNRINAFTYLGPEEVVFMRDQKFKAQKKDTPKEISIYQFEFDMKGEMTGMESIAEPVDFKHKMTLARLTSDLKSLQFTFAKGDQVKYVVGQFK